jgi:DNA (cytosine-5)-methyltransferase 1
MENEALDCAPVWDDLTSFDGKPWRGIVDIVHGGYPCQPFSVAGKKLGDKDPRHLWPHIARIVREIEPALCFFENVGGHLRLGFEQVHDDLRQMGYGVKAGLFSAEEVGAPHRRERLFILAYAEGAGKQRGSGNFSGAHERQDG